MNFSKAHTENQLMYKGKNSDIYLNTYETYNTPTILKVLAEEYPDDNKIAQFKNEYHLLKDIHIEGVRKALDTIVTSDNKHGLVLEHVEGQTLQEAFKEAPPSITHFLQIAIQLAEIFSQLHQKGIIHKDVNNKNILIDENLQKVTLIDFGMSTKIKFKSQHFGNPNVLEGTLPYLSPEQTGRMNRVVDYRTDLYSLGVTLYHLITGVLPFEGEEAMALIHAHISRAPKPPHMIRAKIPEVLSQIILKLLSKNAEDRYQSAYGLQEDLKRCLHEYQVQRNISVFDLAQNDYSQEFSIPEKLYGREKEKKILLQSFQNISTGKKELLLIGGNSGVGKSALISEIHKPITEKRGLFIEGKFDQFQRDIPYYGFIQAFNGLVNLLLTENSSVIQYWKDLILHAVGDLGKLLIDLVPKLEMIIGEQPVVNRLTGIEAQNRFNYVLQQFITAIAKEQHPLVLFIDDWQWADQASIDLLKSIMTKPKGEYLLIIGAYRNNETPKRHPFSIAVSDINLNLQHSQKAYVHTFWLQSLTSEQVHHLVSDTLKGEESFVKQLANLVFEKTDGNAFFVKYFFMSLYEEGLLYFDSEIQRWTGDLDAIYQQDFTDNVVELMLKKVKKLPQKTLEKLKLAACVGNRFYISTLSTLSENASKATIEEDLLPAIREGFLLPTSVPNYLETYTQNSHSIVYQFAHDHVQQAFYSLVQDTDKQHFHFKIGTLLLNKVKEGVSELLIHNKAIVDKIFDIVKHLNIGKHFVIDRDDKDELAQLNLIAGKKAKSSAAFQAANTYLQQAINLLGAGAFERNYQMALDLYETATEAAYMSSDSEKYQEMITTVLAQVHTIEDTIKVRNVQIQAFIKSNQPLEAVNLGETILDELGMSFPENPHKLQIIVKVLQTQISLMKYPTASLLDHPEMKNKRLLAVMEVMAPTSVAAYWSKPSVMPLLVMKMLHLSVKYGNNSFSPFAYSAYGIILCGVLGKIEKGYEFGELALELMNKYKYTAYRARTMLVVNQMILPWKEHLRKSLQPLEEASKIAMKDGDVEMASLIAYLRLTHSFVVGSPIHTLQLATKECVEWIKGLRQERVVHFAVMLKQVLENFNMRTEKPEKLSGVFYKESKMLEVFEESSDSNARCTHYLYSAQLALYFRKYELALENTKKMEAFLEAAISTPIVPLYYFYNSLAYLGCFHLFSKTEQIRALKQIAANQKKIKKWAKHAPMNFRHKYLLVEAERFRVLNNSIQAQIYYDRAIDQAFKNQYVQEEGLAYELAGRFNQQRGGKKHLVKAYMQGAHECYRRWGAYGLCIKLRKEFSIHFEKTPLFSNIDYSITSVSTSSGGFDTFDLHSILKTSQTLSREVNFSKLMRKMMQIITENAGAERGFFMLSKGTHLHIEVAYNYQPSTDILEYEDVEDGIVLVDSDLVENIDSPKQILSDKIVYYVARSREPLVLDNASQNEQFANCVYIRLNKPKSIVCTPILNQGKLLGVLYLENNQLTSAFNHNRVQLLNMLGSQTAISLNNALLYNNLEQIVEERTKEISLQKEEIEKQKGRIELQNELITKRLKFKEQFFSNVSHELRTPLNGVTGMANLLLDTPLNAEQKNYVEVVKNSSDNLVIIINDLLDIAKITAGKLKIVEQIFSLSVLLKDFQTSLKSKVKEKGLSFVIQSDILLPEYVIGDRVRVYQILLNLLNNAIKFTEKGEVRMITTLLKQTEKTSLLRFEVSDTGIGIAEDKLEQIFGSYDQVIDKEGLHYEGTGLGLSIVKQLVQMMGGTIKINSEENVGSTFSIELEFDVVTEEQVEVERNKNVQSREIPESWIGKKILILEDNEINQLYALKLLEKYQFNLTIAGDLAEARQELSKTKFDCLLADVRLPDGNGIDLVAEIQQTEGHLNQNVPVIVLTAGISEEERNRIKDLSIQAYMNKPFNPNVLNSCLRDVFQPGEPKGVMESQKNNDYFAILSERMGGSQTATREILFLFLQKIATTITTMKQAVNLKDWKSLYAEVHQIKSTIQLIGLSNLEPTVLKLNDYSYYQKNLEEIPSLVATFERLAAIDIAKIEEMLK